MWLHGQWPLASIQIYIAGKWPANDGGLKGLKDTLAPELRFEMVVCLCWVVCLCVCILHSTAACSEPSAFIIQFSQFWEFVSEILRREKVVCSFAKTTKESGRLQAVKCWCCLCCLPEFVWHLVHPLASDLAVSCRNCSCMLPRTSEVKIFLGATISSC